MLILPYTGMALTFTVDGINYSSDDGYTASVISNSEKYAGDVTIPSTVSYNNVKYLVRSIGRSAFSGCTGLTSIEMPYSVSSIERAAFYGCTGLTSITMPSGVTYIGESAFSRCAGLTSITIPSSVTSIRSAAFYGCKGLKSIEIPNSVTSIDELVFHECTGLTSITIPSSVTSIGRSAFEGCTGLKSIVIPSSVTSIEYFAFSGCAGLTSIIVDKNNKVYDSRNNCNAIIETATNTLISGCSNTTIPSSVTSIRSTAFYRCTGLSTIKIPNSITSISSKAFYGCTGLTSITIPSSVTSIGESAFVDCTGLTSITIPSSVTSIGESAFVGCTGITSIEIPSNVTLIEMGAFGRCTGLTSITIPNSVTSIGRSAFEGCTGLTSIEIPSSVTSISDSAFKGCTGLTSIEIPSSVEIIYWSAFKGCTGLTSVYFNAENCEYDVYDESAGSDIFAGCPIERFVFGESVKIIPEYCCNDLTRLTSIEIPKNVTSIGASAFSGCIGLTSIYFNAENCHYVGSDTFAGCPIEKFMFGEFVKIIPGYCCNDLTRLTSIEIPNSVTSIGGSAFNGCTGLTSVYWNAENCQSIASSSFKDCPIEKFVYGESVKIIPGYCCNDLTRLTSIEIPNSVTSIGRSAFVGCTGITSIEIPSNVTLIEMGAFGGCTGLTSIYFNAEDCNVYYDTFAGSGAFVGCPIEKFVFGESVKIIPSYCCCDMTRLTLIKIPKNVTSIRFNAFSGCTGVTSIEIPSSVTSIEDRAFSGCTGLTSIEIPKSVTSIGESVFGGCTELSIITVDKNNAVYDSRDNCNAIIETASNMLIAGCKSTKIPNGARSIGKSAFSGCEGLTSIEIPNSVTSIGSNAFYACTELNSVEIPNSVTSIEGGAFYRCTSLTSVEIPNGVTSIGFSAFSGCTGISKIWCFANIPPKVYSYTFSDIDKSIPIYVPCGSIEDYKNADGWSEFTNYNCISADPVEEEIDEPTVTPEKTSVVIAWPVDESAETYIINITKGGVTVCTITFDANGNVITIDYPSNGSTKGAELRDANALPNGYSYEITGLEEGTEYVYTVTAQNGSGVTVAEYSGTFRTQGGAVSVEEYNTNSSSSLQNAIIVNGKSISVNGAEPSDIIIYNTAGKQVSNPVPASGVYVVKVGDEAVKVMVK